MGFDNINVYLLASLMAFASGLGRSALWVKQQISKGKIKPALSFKRTHYFEKETLQELENKKKRGK
jgi:hypothetical protein